MDKLSIFIEKAKNVENKKFKFLIFTCILISIYFINTICNIACYSFTLFKALDNLVQKKTHNVAMILLVFILLNLLDVVEFLLYKTILSIIPFYFLVKVIFIAILMLPDLKGLNYIYSNVLLYILSNNDDKYSLRYKLEDYFQDYDRRYSSKGPCLSPDPKPTPTEKIDIDLIKEK